MALPVDFMALMTRTRTAELVAPTYAKLRDIDVNEAYRRLEGGLRDATLLADLQHVTWRALRDEKAEWSEAQLLASLNKRAQKTKRYRAPTWGRRDEGDWIAVQTRLDLASGYASGEAYDLLESEGGRALLASGLARLGAHLARELLR